MYLIIENTSGLTLYRLFITFLYTSQYWHNSFYIKKSKSGLSKLRLLKKFNLI